MKQDLNGVRTPEDVMLRVNGIQSEMREKVGKDEIISRINQTAEKIGIEASKVHLEGYTTINNNFSIDLEGNMSCKNANISGAYQNYEGDRLAISMSKTTIRLYDWRGSGKVSGRIMAVTYGSEDNYQTGVNFDVFSGSKLGLSYTDEDGVVQNFLSFDSNDPTSTPWIKNTASGTIFPDNESGVTVQNGLIKTWDLHLATGSIQIPVSNNQTLTIVVKSGLIHSWSTS